MRMSRWHGHLFLLAVATSTLYYVCIFKFSVHDHEYFEHYFQVSYVSSGTLMDPLLSRNDCNFQNGNNVYLVV